MKVLRERHEGVTLIEVMFVLVIGVSIIFYSIEQYLTFKIDSDAATLRANVDTVMLAMSKYYSAICYGPVDPATNGSNSRGMVATTQLTGPASGGSTTYNFYTVDVYTALVQGGYLSTILPYVPFLIYKLTAPGATTTEANAAYYKAQFIADAAGTYRQVCLYTVFNTTTGQYESVSGPYDTKCVQVINTGQTVTWTVQVAAQVPSDKADVYLKLTNATCLSTAYVQGSVTVIAPCSWKTGGNYLVWERLPSFASSQVTANMEGQAAGLQQFKQMYTTYPILNLMGNVPTGTISSNPSVYQQFLCGG